MKTDEIKLQEKKIHPEAIHELAHKNKQLHHEHKQEKLYDDLLKIKAERHERELKLRPLFLNVGMAVSILLAIIAINWKVYDTGELVDLGQLEVEANEIIDIPISKQPPPPPPKQEVFTIKEVENTEIIEDLEIALDVEVTANAEVEEIEFTPPVEEEEKVEEIFVIVEQEPTPKGGLVAFYTYLSEELKYPAAAARLGVSGTVYVRFVIEKDGSITAVEVAKGIGAGCDEEAVRVIQNAPPWNPGKQRGVPVRVRKIIPVKFLLKG
ncbi:MAG: energy transducer TonB [Ekhidna sp.]